MERGGNIFPEIAQIINHLDQKNISKERKAALQPLIDFMQSKVAKNQTIRLNFICTHNSRRSHLSQVWAQTMGHYFRMQNIYCYSGGTTATALYPMVVKTLQNVGFRIHRISTGDNPVYHIKYASNEHPIIGFSKKWEDEFNPRSEFAAIMTCHSAHEMCPSIPGAEKRIPLIFEDPKAFDNTPQQAEKYRERSLQIATELYYVFSQLEG
ncbi:MAG: protein-tyrosine-phosphatase [Bacteroidetes bacterium]|nr:MAG: protein-tyrosine-phosphatase [Bacteroidota bacterium]PIE87954.1 MAG: protein-tyrosine-phosphatase [Bacteroidota bacterium]